MSAPVTLAPTSAAPTAPSSAAPPPADEGGFAVVLSSLAVPDPAASPHPRSAGPGGTDDSPDEGPDALNASGVNANGSAAASAIAATLTLPLTPTLISAPTPTVAAAPVVGELTAAITVASAPVTVATADPNPAEPGSRPGSVGPGAQPQDGARAGLLSPSAFGLGTLDPAATVPATLPATLPATSSAASGSRAGSALGSSSMGSASALTPDPGSPAAGVTLLDRASAALAPVVPAGSAPQPSALGESGPGEFGEGGRGEGGRGEASAGSAQFGWVAAAPVLSPSTVVSPSPAPTPPPSAAAPPDPQPELVATLSRLRARGDGSHELSVQLHPAELGAVTVSAVIGNGQLTVTLACADEAARAAVTAALPALHHQLSNAGLGGVDVRFGGPPNGRQEPPAGQPDAEPGPDGRPGRDGPPTHQPRTHQPPIHPLSTHATPTHQSHAARRSASPWALDRLL